MTKDAGIVIKPQPGFQEKVATSTADISIIGGAAGCGKSFIMIYLPLKFKDDPNLRVTYFRRTQKMIREAGAIWDESTKVYPLFGANPSESTLKWKFKAGGIVNFVGIEYEKDLINFQGAAIPIILFDELTHFTKKQFFFMLSRNRGIFEIGKKGYVQKPQVFGSCNPDPDSWVASLIEWYIDQETGYPIPEREGKLRYFIVVKDKVVWGDSKQEVFEKNQSQFKDPAFLASGIHPFELIKSFTFIGGKIYDNKKLLGSNPGYLASLMSQSEADQERFLKGNWKIRADDSGLYDYHAIDRMMSTDVEGAGVKTKFKVSFNGPTEVRTRVKNYNSRFITCDAAKFGRDLCVIYVWDDMTVIFTVIFYLSSPFDIYKEIELQMVDFDVLRKNVLIDQDGIGGDVVKLGKYYGFMARRLPAVEESTKQPENYASRKDQCYYRSAEKVNSGETKVVFTNSTVKIYDKGSKNPRYSCMLKWDNDMIHIGTLLKKQLSAIKRGKTEFEGGIIKICTNSKDEQKEILGHSPDLADTLMMREDFFLNGRRTGKFKKMR